MTIQDVSTWALSIYKEYGLYVVFLLVFLDSWPFVGLVLPAISILIGAGFASADITEALTIFFVALIAMLLADNLWYGIGRVTKGRWQWLSRAIDGEPALRRVILEQNKLILFFYPFPPYFRMFLPATFGVLKAPLSLWIPVNIVASCIFIATCLSVGVLARTAVGDVQSTMRAAEVVFVFISILCVPYVFVLYRRWRKAK